jgi:hypothetical protein
VLVRNATGVETVKDVASDAFHQGLVVTNHDDSEESCPDMDFGLCDSIERQRTAMEALGKCTATQQHALRRAYKEGPINNHITVMNCIMDAVNDTFEWRQRGERHL